MTRPSWLTVQEGDAPLLVSLPHTGIDLGVLEPRLKSRWLGQRDCDWWIEKLYDFAADLGATMVQTAISRTVIDVNRDPSGASLYPGQATTGLCPTETFDGDPLYRDGEEPGPNRNRPPPQRIFRSLPCRTADRDRSGCGRCIRTIVLYDCHSIRSVIPRLFDGTLPVFNLGTNDGRSADPVLQALVTQIMAESRETFGREWPLQGRLDHAPLRRSRQRRACAADGAVLPGLSCASRVGPVDPENWPVAYDADLRSADAQDADDDS